MGMYSAKLYRTGPSLWQCRAEKAEAELADATGLIGGLEGLRGTLDKRIEYLEKALEKISTEPPDEMSRASSTFWPLSLQQMARDALAGKRSDSESLDPIQEKG